MLHLAYLYVRYQRSTSFHDIGWLATYRMFLVRLLNPMCLHFFSAFVNKNVVYQTKTRLKTIVFIKNDNKGAFTQTKKAANISS